MIARITVRVNPAMAVTAAALTAVWHGERRRRLSYKLGFKLARRRRYRWLW